MKNKKINTNLSNYIKAFNAQDLANLEKMFARNIVLKDWERNIKGKKNVLKENRNIFNSVDSIKCKILKKFFFKNTAICILEIRINNKEIINVVDMIEFNIKNQITKISAYKG